MCFVVVNVDKIGKNCYSLCFLPMCWELLSHDYEQFALFNNSTIGFLHTCYFSRCFRGFYDDTPLIRGCYHKQPRPEFSVFMAIPCLLLRLKPVKFVLGAFVSLNVIYLITSTFYEILDSLDISTPSLSLMT